MTPSDIFRTYSKSFPGWSWRDGPSHADSDAYEVGSHSVWLEDGTWRVGVESGSSYSHASGWEPGDVAELHADDGGGPHQDFEVALQAAIEAEVTMRLARAADEIGEARRYEMDQVMEVHES